MDRKDLEEVKDYLIPHLDNRYVQVADCEVNQKESEAEIELLKQANQKRDVKYAKMDTKLNVIIGIVSVIGSVLFPACLKIIFKGLF